MKGVVDSLGAVGILFLLIFLAAFLLILFAAIGVIRQSRRLRRMREEDDRSPRLTVLAKIVAKHSHLTVRCHGDDGMHRSRTTYFTTFQVDSGDRMELCVPAEEYGLLVEGDEGELTFQGSRFLRFDRK